MKKTINLFWIGVFIFVMLGGLVTTEEVASAETANLCIISYMFNK